MKKIYILFMILAMLTVQSDLVFANQVIMEETELNFEFLGRDDGLSNLSVSTILQDKYGFLWFGTQGGLNCYDGNEMKVIRNNPFEENGLLHNLIQTMYYDEKNHELWIGTYQGISRYFIAENRFVNYTVDNNQLSNSIVIAITMDSNGDMWFGTMNGLNKLEQESDQFIQYEVPGEVVRSLLTDSKGRVLVGTYEGLYQFKAENKGLEQLPLDLPAPYVMTLDEFDKGILTLGLWGGGLATVDMETNAIKVKEYADNQVYSLIETNDGTRWVGTWGGGLFTEDSQGNVTSFRSEGKSQSLAHNIVYSLYEDDSGIVWLGTNGGGINKINPRKKNLVELAYDPEQVDSLSQGKINKIFEDKEGKLWIAIYNNGFNVYDPVSKSIDKYMNDPEDEQTLPNNQINEFYEFGEVMLLGSNAGLMKFDEDTKQFSMFEGFPDEVLVYSIEQVNDTELWVGTYSNGLFIYNIQEQIYEKIESDKEKNPVADNLIYDIYADTKGRVWIATNNGLNMKKSDSEAFQLFKKENGNHSSLASNTIRSISEDSSGRIWIAMLGGGVAYYEEENESFVSFTEKDGLSSNIVTGVIEDDNGVIWCATENGIAIIHPEGREISSLTPYDGIGGWEFTSGIIKTNDGSLVLGGAHGIARIPRDFSSSYVPEPRVYITDVKLFHEPIDENRLFFNDAVLNFGPDDSYLEFKVVALNFDDSEETKYIYKLEGFDTEWFHAGTRDYISYSNLPAGEYELIVLSEAAKNVLSEPVSLKFSIATAWYKSIYALVAYVLLMIGLLIAFSKLREGRMMERRNAELGIINKKLGEANSKLEQLSEKDSLTKLFNRRYFDMKIADQLKLAIRGKFYLSVIMIDLDNFKQVNDKFGHVAGDCLLADVGEALGISIGRATDFVSRYGGDEFAIVLLGTNPDNTLIVANKIAKELGTVKVRAQYTSEAYFLTASIGIACKIPKLDSTVEDYIDVADRELYRSKEAGRNRISLADNQ